LRHPKLGALRYRAISVAGKSVATVIETTGPCAFPISQAGDCAEAHPSSTYTESELHIRLHNSGLAIPAEALEPTRRQLRVASQGELIGISIRFGMPDETAILEIWHDFHCSLDSAGEDALRVGYSRIGEDDMWRFVDYASLFPATSRGSAHGRSRFGDGWQLDQRPRLLTDPNDVAVPLTKAEYALLVAFLDAPRRPLGRKHLMQATRMHEEVFDRTIDVQVLRLRRKLEADRTMPRLIKERGVGYLLDTTVETI
jgi:Transcriptional regulatory protein, C terminal